MGCKAPQAMEWDGVGMTDTAKRMIEAANPYTRGARHSQRADVGKYRVKRERLGTGCIWMGSGMTAMKA